MDFDDTIEWLKIIIALVIGYILIKALLFKEVNHNEIKCLCDCTKDVIHLG